MHEHHTGHRGSADMQVMHHAHAAHDAWRRPQGGGAVTHRAQAMRPSGVSIVNGCLQVTIETCQIMLQRLLVF